MNDDQIPETPTEIAKRLWDTAIEHLQQATDEVDVGLSDAYCAIGELALKAAQFALANPGLLVGIPENYGLPAGAPPLPPGIIHPGVAGPRVWGAPTQ